MRRTINWRRRFKWYKSMQIGLNEEQKGKRANVNYLGGGDAQESNIDLTGSTGVNLLNKPRRNRINTRKRRFSYFNIQLDHWWVRKCWYLARVIYEAGRVAVDGGVDDRLLVDAEHVAAHSLGFVVLLALVAHHRTDHFAGVLHHHFPALLKQNQKKKKDKINQQSIQSQLALRLYLNLSLNARNNNIRTEEVNQPNWSQFNNR